MGVGLVIKRNNDNGKYLFFFEPVLMGLSIQQLYSAPKVTLFKSEELV